MDSSPITLEGGFLPPHPSTTGLLSPSASSVSSANRSDLPHPRTTPLRSGGPKESAFIRFVDKEILRVRRRFAKRTEVAALEDDEAKQGADMVMGYKNFAEAAMDVQKLVDVIWVSGTPSLQIPYLLSLALLITTLLPSLPPSPKPTFRLLRKLDHAFASLLQGHDTDTGEPLPGFSSGPKVTGTEKVRMKSLVERTRVVVVEVLSGVEFEEEGGMEETEDEEDFNMGETTEEEEEDGGEMRLEGEDGGDEFEMQLARIYDRTMVELGDTIGSGPIGMISDD